VTTSALIFSTRDLEGKLETAIARVLIVASYFHTLHHAVSLAVQSQSYLVSMLTLLRDGLLWKSCFVLLERLVSGRCENLASPHAVQPSLRRIGMLMVGNSGDLM
jgi:hypothetical protein